MSVVTPPGAKMARQSAEAIAPAAVLSSLRPEVLKKRADFLRAARAGRTPTPGFLLQARARGSGGAMRVGFTCSKKLGNAVTRNRAKRRLRAVVQQVLPVHGRAGWDYVLVGRPGTTVTHDFATMCRDLERALAKLHKQHGGRA
ncbi:MAG: ribonuclease P protein component [Rhodobacteraceae bacterium]|nr:ribonuclease P protein component [Paracoccaceae bacterium]TVR45244.1 MAG: ribonuclease P protein component [Paracoccaceae bacterium]